MLISKPETRALPKYEYTLHRIESSSSLLSDGHAVFCRPLDEVISKREVPVFHAVVAHKVNSKARVETRKSYFMCKG
jgi:hypothetical protein